MKDAENQIGNGDRCTVVAGPHRGRGAIWRIRGMGSS